MRILATGGAGYVGSATLRHLIAQGHDVTVYDNLCKGHRQAVPADLLVQGDLDDTKLLLNTLRDRQIEIVMHFAAFIAVGESVADPRSYYRNNIANSLSLLETIQDAGIQKILFSSTAAVYAPIAQGALHEDSPKGPASPYAFSKYVIERMIEDFSKAFGLGYTILRYFNACGGSEQGQFGEDHDPETHLIPLVLQVPLGQREAISVFGNDYDTPDGTCIRDYIHVDDLALAHRLAAEAMQPNEGNIYNIGTGTGNSVLEVIETAQEVVGKEIKTIITDRRAGDTDRLVASSAKLRKQLGWVPQQQSLKDIIQSAWQWHKANPKGYRD